MTFHPCKAVGLPPEARMVPTSSAGDGVGGSSRWCPSVPLLQIPSSAWTTLYASTFVARMDFGNQMTLGSGSKSMLEPSSFDASLCKWS